MTHTYNITGMTCTGCQYKVKGLLEKVPGVTEVDIDLEKGKADISMNEHVATPVLQSALKDYPKYQLTEDMHQHVAATPVSFSDEEDKRTWLQTYKPILLIFGYITVISVLLGGLNGSFNWMKSMTVFMSGFFLIFSLFKMLNLSAFADSYSMYDIVAKKWRGWGYVYAFIELGLGVAYAINFNIVLISIITFVVMTVSIVGVLQSVLNKHRIQCACLGAVFNLPMSTVTIIEDALMIVMSAAMVIAMV
ncbi:heavy-metal-associated domain-containing protein [Mucilaginibacter limnophilus]|uniref:Heavy-metal-associated domain-containing protein n=1 Tax=Mucilaginibacter limnophilus TaxID=1932778 RepID=A0A437ML48_9SPHI|nr:heavy metal-associated domain-containing protein [Mucilaginibacter limnophilus]RVT98326.1 heavy-metal-associated domain-containing protein [Mucilaginibacter limnophilus]